MTPGSGLIGNVGMIRANAFAVDLVANSAITPDDRLGLEVSQPLRVDHATAILNLPTARDLAGNVLRSDQAIDLAPTGRELDIQVAWRVPIDALIDRDVDADLELTGLARTAPDHDQTAPTDYLMGLRWRMRW